MSAGTHHNNFHWRVTQEVATEESEALVGSPMLRLDTDLPLFNFFGQTHGLSIGFHADLDEALCPNPTIISSLRAIRGNDGFTSISHLRQLLKLDTSEQLLHSGEQRQGYKDAPRKVIIRIAAPVQHMSRSASANPYSLVAEQAELDSSWQRHLESMMEELFSEDDEQHARFCEQSALQDMRVDSVAASADAAASHVRSAALVAAKREVTGVVEEHGFRSMSSMSAQQYMPQLSMTTRGVYAQRDLHHGELLWPPIGGLMADLVDPDEAEAERLFAGVPNLDETLCDVLIDSGAAALHSFVWQDPEQHRRSHTGFGRRQLSLNMLPLSNAASAVNQAKHFDTLQSSDANVYPVRVVVGITRRQRSRTGRVQADDIILQVPMLFWFVWNPIKSGEEVLGEKMALLQETYGQDVETTISFADLKLRCDSYSAKLSSAAARVLALLWARAELGHVQELQLFQKREGIAVEKEERLLAQGSDVASMQRRQELLAERKRLRESGEQLAARRKQLESESQLLQQAAQRDLFVTLITLAERVTGSLQLIQTKEGVVAAAALHERARRGIWHMRHNLGKQFMQDTKPNPLYVTDTQQRQLWRSIDVRLVHGEQVTVKNSAVAAAEASRGSTVAQAEAVTDAERNSLQEQRLRLQQTKRYGLERLELDKRLRKMRELLARLTSAVISAGLGPFLQVPMQRLPVRSAHPRHLLLWGPQPPDVHYNAYAARRWWTVFALTVLGLTPLDLLWLRRHLIFEDDPARRWYGEVYVPGKRLPAAACPVGDAPGEPPAPGELFTRPNPEMHHQIARVQASAPPAGAPGTPAYIHALAETTPAWAAISDSVAPQLQLRESTFAKAAVSLPECLGPRPRAVAESLGAAGAPAQPHWLLRCAPVGRLPSAQQQQREMSANEKLMLSHDQEFHLPPIPGHMRMLTQGVLLRGCQRSPTLHRVVALSSPALFDVLASRASRPAQGNAEQDGDSDGSEDTILDEGVAEAATAAGGNSDDAAKHLDAANSKLALRTARKEIFVDGVQACNLLEHFHFADQVASEPVGPGDPAPSLQPGRFCASRDEPMLAALACLTTLRRDEQLKNPEQGVLQWQEYPAQCVQASRGRPAAVLRTVRPLDGDELYLLTGDSSQQSTLKVDAHHPSGFRQTGSLLTAAETDGVLDTCRAVLTPTPLEAACAAALVADEALLYELVQSKPQLQASSGLHAHMEHLQDCLEMNPADAAAYLLPCLPPHVAVDEVYQLPGDDDDSDDCDDFDVQDAVPLSVDSSMLHGVLPCAADVLECSVTHKWEGGAVQGSHEPGSASWRKWIALRDQRDFASAPLSVRVPALLAGVQPTYLRSGVRSWCYRKQQLMPKDVKRVAELFDGGERHEGVFVPRNAIELAKQHGRQLTPYFDPDAPVFSALRGLWTACDVFQAPPYAMEQDVVRRFTYSLSFLAGRPRPRHLLEPSKYQVDSTLSKRWAMTTVLQMSAIVFHASDWVGRIFKPVHGKALGRAVQAVELRRRQRAARRLAARKRAKEAMAAAAVQQAMDLTEDLQLPLPGSRKRPLGGSAAPSPEGSSVTGSPDAGHPAPSSSVFGRALGHSAAILDQSASLPPAHAGVGAPEANAGSAVPAGVFDASDSEDDEPRGLATQQQQAHHAVGAASVLRQAGAAVGHSGVQLHQRGQAPAVALPAYMIPTHQQEEEDAYLPPAHDM